MKILSGLWNPLVLFVTNHCRKLWNEDWWTTLMDNKKTRTQIMNPLGQTFEWCFILFGQHFKFCKRHNLELDIKMGNQAAKKISSHVTTGFSLLISRSFIVFFELHWFSFRSICFDSYLHAESTKLIRTVTASFYLC